MRRALAALCVFTLAVAGCGGPDPVPHRTWVTTVCRALAPWRDQLTALNAKTAQQLRTATTPGQTRDRLLSLLDGARQASDDARSKVSGAGIPDVKDGAAIAERFVNALTAVRDAYGRARDTVKGLPDGTFYAGVSTAMDRLNADYAKAGVDTAKVASPDLRKDFDEVPACG